MTMTGEEMLTQVAKLYEGRTTGDLSAFHQVLAPDARFFFMGNESVVKVFPAGDTQDPNDPNAVAQALFDEIAMNACTFGKPIAQGNHLAVTVSATLQVEGRPEFEHEMFDLWEFNDDGKVISGHQYQDTAKLVEELRYVKK
ncbi:MAG: nuclear transport factor 2 family protein [Pseudomonadota bacterium]